MEIKIASFRPFLKNTLKGFATILVEPVGLEIRDLLIHQKGEARWIGMPSRKVRSEGGEESWVPVIQLPENKKKESFQKAVLAALDEHLGAGEEAPPDLSF